MNIFYTNFHHGWGGQPLQVLQLAGAMNKRGHEVTVFAPEGSELALRVSEAGLELSTCCSFPRGLRPLKIFHDITSFRKMIVEKRAEIVHCHGSQDTWIAAGALMGMKARCKFVRTKHNSYPAARHAANRWLYNRAIDRTITVADPIREELLAGEFVKPEKVKVIHAGLDDNFSAKVDRTRKEIREELGIGKETPLVGLVGRLAPDKGQDTLLQAAKILEQSFPDAHFLLIGTGGDWDRIRNLIGELGLGERVTWAGFRDDVPAVTAALDISVLAARACDASSTVLKEAMILGVPVIGTDVGGTADILDDGKAGLLIEPGSAEALAGAITSILSQPKEAEERADHAKDYVKRYLASSIAAETEAVYQSVIGQTDNDREGKRSNR